MRGKTLGDSPVILRHERSHLRWQRPRDAKSNERKAKGATLMRAKQQREVAWRGKELPGQAKGQPIMLEDLRGQKMNFKSPAGLGTRQKARWQSSRNRKRTG